ncbi:hypothetical protein A9Q96_00505 [Rhodobacterales bacterium 52_120_T64]|nr:hypothetical protein A9Q96_00505 [Rhodobacterales bacterium 52_120_T64]
MSKKARIDKSINQGGYEATSYDDLGSYKKKASKQKRRRKDAPVSTTTDIEVAIAEQRVRDKGE